VSLVSDLNSLITQVKAAIAAQTWEEANDLLAQAEVHVLGIPDSMSSSNERVRYQIEWIPKLRLFIDRKMQTATGVQRTKVQYTAIGAAV